MPSKGLGLLIKAAVIIVAVLGIFACGFIFVLFTIFAAIVLEYYAMALLMLIFAFVLPCYVILFFVWKVADAAEEGRQTEEKGNNNQER